MAGSPSLQPPGPPATPLRKSASTPCSRGPIEWEQEIDLVERQAKSMFFCKEVRAQGRKSEPVREGPRDNSGYACVNPQSRWRPVAKGDYLVSIPVGATRLDASGLASRSTAWVTCAGGLCEFASGSAHCGLPTVSPRE
jgi:hypothetical protein